MDRGAIRMFRLLTQLGPRRQGRNFHHSTYKYRWNAILGRCGFKPLFLLRTYTWFIARDIAVHYGTMVTDSPHWNRPPDRTKPKSDGALWEHHDPNAECADGIYLLAQETKEGSSLFVMPGDGGHHYITLTKIKIDPTTAVSLDKLVQIIFTALSQFPSIVKTIIDGGFIKAGQEIVLNKSDHVKSFGEQVRATSSYISFRVPVGTVEGCHSLGGLVDHGALIYADGADQWLVIWKKGLGHQKSLDTPGTSLSDAINIAAGGGILADRRPADAGIDLRGRNRRSQPHFEQAVSPVPQVAEPHRRHHFTPDRAADFLADVSSHCGDMPVSVHMCFLRAVVPARRVPRGLAGRDET